MASLWSARAAPPPKTFKPSMRLSDQSVSSAPSLTGYTTDVTSEEGIATRVHLPAPTRVLQPQKDRADSLVSESSVPGFVGGNNSHRVPGLRSAVAFTPGAS